MPQPNSSDHALHDALLVAGHAAGDLADADRVRADSLLADCAACGDLRRDLVAIAAATRSVPAPATRPRDLQLSPEQAARLHRGSWLRGVLRPFAAASSPIRPMAAAFTSLGVVGLLVGVTLTGGPGAASLTTTGGAAHQNGAPAAASAGAGDDLAGGNMFEANRSPHVPLAADASQRAAAVEMSTTNAGRDDEDDKASVVPESTRIAGAATQVPGPKAQDGGDAAAMSSGSVTPQSPSPLIAGSLALLGIGLLLFGLRIASRRLS